MTLSEEGLTAATTHVAIYETGCPQPLARTPAYLEALIRGLLVVKMAWLWDSIVDQDKAAPGLNALRSVDKYLISDAARLAVAGPEAGVPPGSVSAPGPRLLADCDVVLGAGVGVSAAGAGIGFSRDVLAHLMGLAGGRVLDKEGGELLPGGTPGGGGGGGGGSGSESLAVAMPAGGARGQLLVVETDTSTPFSLERLGPEWAAASSAVAVRRLSVEGLLDAFAALRLPRE